MRRQRDERFDIKEIARICGGTLHNCRADLGNQEVSTITTDSRKVEQGALFVAIPVHG